MPDAVANAETETPNDRIWKVMQEIGRRASIEAQHKPAQFSVGYCMAMAEVLDLLEQAHNAGAAGR